VALAVALPAAEVVTALGGDLAATWDALLAGATAVSSFGPAGEGPRAAPVFGDAEQEDDPILRILGRPGQLLERAVRRASDGARLAALARERVGLHVAIGMGDLGVEDLGPAVLASREGGRLDLARFFAGGYRQIHPLWPLSALGNVGVGQISIDLDVRGDNLVLASEADAGLRAILEGAFAVAEGACDATLAGGASEALGPGAFLRLALRGREAAPGEGAAALALVREGDGAPLGLLRGGATAFGLAEGGLGPTEDAVGRAVEGALRSAGWAARDVDAVFLHAEGTEALDEAEVRAVDRTLGARVRLVATKGALGHLAAAAPAADVAIALAACHAGRLPPSRAPAPLLDATRGRLAAAPVACPLRRFMVLASSSHGGAGALAAEGTT
jgi:3-oxoacyl-[acyl-carrier-protein] synthase II